MFPLTGVNKVSVRKCTVFSCPMPDLCSRRLGGLGNTLSSRMKIAQWGRGISKLNSNLMAWYYFFHKWLIYKKAVLFYNTQDFPFSFKLTAVLPKLCFHTTKFPVISLSYRTGFFKMQSYFEREYLILCSLWPSDSNIKTASVWKKN